MSLASSCLGPHTMDFLLYNLNEQPSHLPSLNNGPLLNRLVTLNFKVDGMPFRFRCIPQRMCIHKYSGITIILNRTYCRKEKMEAIY